MSQFLGFTIFFTIVAGMILHSGVELPFYFSWVGALPGDLIIKKKGLMIYAPFSSSLLFSAGLSLFLSPFGRK